MMNNKPDSKDYKRTSLNHNYSFRLPYAVKRDFDKYLKAFPNTNKGMLEIIIDVGQKKQSQKKENYKALSSIIARKASISMWKLRF